MHEGMANRQPQMGPPMCVCASRHPDKPGCTSVDANAHCTDVHTTLARVRAHAHAHAPMESTRTLIHINAHVHTYQMYARGDARLVGARVCRSRRARARTYAHAHICM